VEGTAEGKRKRKRGKNLGYVHQRKVVLLKVQFPRNKKSSVGRKRKERGTINLRRRKSV